MRLKVVLNEVERIGENAAVFKILKRFVKLGLSANEGERRKEGTISIGISARYEHGEDGQRVVFGARILERETKKPRRA
jgi:hypothetical protein